MIKKELGKQIEALRKECGVSTYDTASKKNQKQLKNIFKNLQI